MDVVAWLRGLGLEQYGPAFRENDVDAEVLPELTADDLISIGVTSVGHRRKLLAGNCRARDGRGGACSEPTHRAHRRQPPPLPFPAWGGRRSGG